MEEQLCRILEAKTINQSTIDIVDTLGTLDKINDLLDPIDQV